MSHAALPTVDPVVALADRCVQCGLCLPACPTYGHDQVETESPRGRIALMRAWALEAIEPTPTGDAHLDHCLGCRNCEAVCPAFVQYDELLILGRSRQRDRRGPSPRRRAAEALAARPRVLACLLGFYRHIYRWLPQAWRLLPRPPAPEPPLPMGALATPVSPVALFVGCVAGPYEPPVQTALARLCAGFQVEVIMPTGQTCCGSLHGHGGDAIRAARLGATNSHAFSAARTVLTLASGCHDTLARSLGPAIETEDALVFLDRHGEGLRFRECQERVAVHLPCTQRHSAGSVPALRRLLARVPGLQVVELTAGYGCCGAAGTQWLEDPARADGYRRPLLDQLAASGATRLLSANIGCRLHLSGGTVLPVQHPIELLAEALQRPGGSVAPEGAVKSAA